MARKTGLFDGTSLSIGRAVAGVIAADNASLIDANYPVAQGLNCAGLDTIFVGVEIANGSSPTATIELLYRDDDAPDGSRWKRMLLGASPGVTATALANPTTGALAQNSDLVELRTYGHPLVFLRISAVANPTSTTNINVLVRPGQVRARRGVSA